MSDNKKYYYLKLKENFYDEDEIVVLESLPDGFLYSNILMKLYLRSLKYDGRLMFNDRIPFNSQMLSSITRQPVAVVEKAITIFKDMGLIEILDNGAIYILDIQNFIGHTSTEAERKREYRNRIKAEKESKGLIAQSDGQMSDKCPTIRPPEIELELENKSKRQIKSKRENILSGKPDFVFPKWLSESSVITVKKGSAENYEVRIPIAYLNQATGKAFKFVEKSLKLVKSRLNDGYTLEDFKQVIDIKSNQWLMNQDMNKYLRPETLFGPKFESYLNEKPAYQKQSNVPEWSEPEYVNTTTAEEQAELDKKKQELLKKYSIGGDE